MESKFLNQRLNLRLALGQRPIPLSFAPANDRHSMVLALTDIHADEHFDALRISWVMRITLSAVPLKQISTDQRQPAPASTLQAISEVNRSSIINSTSPIGFGNSNLWVMVNLEASIMPAPAGPKTYDQGGKTAWEQTTGEIKPDAAQLL
jgi:hypothetical protein